MCFEPNHPGAAGVSVVSLPGLEAVYVADQSLNTIQKFTLGL